MEVRRSTELKDINGKEIFEGDTVKYLKYNPERYTTWKVIWNKDYLEFALERDIEYMRFCKNSITNNKIEVI